MSINLYQQKQQLLGLSAKANHSNSAVSSSASWNFDLTSNTSVYRIYSDTSLCYMKLNASANSSNWDYIIPAATIMDFYNYEKSSNVSVISSDSLTHVLVGEY